MIQRKKNENKLNVVQSHHNEHLSLKVSMQCKIIKIKISILSIPVRAAHSTYNCVCGNAELWIVGTRLWLSLVAGNLLRVRIKTNECARSGYQARRSFLR